MELQPLLDDLKDIVVFNGRYRIQLEIPKTSTLTSDEMKRVAEIASWHVDPNKAAAEYEGVRSIVIDRQSPTRIGYVDMKGLQISGIGYRNYDWESFSKSVAVDFDEKTKFYPPSNENFMDKVSGTKMSTSHAEGRKMVHTRPTYRALGTYTLPELENKVVNSMEVSGFGTDNIIVPHVEAYGRFLESDLQNHDGNFGFIVFPIPGSKMQRATHELMQTVDHVLGKSVVQGRIEDDKVIETFHTIAGLYVSSFVEGLRDLHDKARRVHLQTHLSNVYLVKGKQYKIPYLVDWSTTRRLGSDVEENILNRLIDIGRPADDYVSLLSYFFPNMPADSKSVMLENARELAMVIYQKNPLIDVIMEAMIERTEEQLNKKNALDYEVYMQWMKDMGVEGFPESMAARRYVKHDRNVPCPCGSGLKYRKCHGAQHLQ